MNRGFTLLECLVALWGVSLIMWFFFVLAEHIIHRKKNIARFDRHVQAYFASCEIMRDIARAARAEKKYWVCEAHFCAWPCQKRYCGYHLFKGVLTRITGEYDRRSSLWHNCARAVVLEHVRTLQTTLDLIEGFVRGVWWSITLDDGNVISFYSACDV